MNRKNILILAIGLPMLGFLVAGVNVGYAQDDTEPRPLTHYVLVFGTFVIAGLVYSLTGWIKKARKALTGDAVVIEWKKLGKGTALGVMLGVVAFAGAEALGESIVIGDARAFLVQISTNSGAILFADKILLGTTPGVSLRKKKDTGGLPNGG